MVADFFIQTVSQRGSRFVDDTFQPPAPRYDQHLLVALTLRIVK